jgi:hypothetical protein
MIRVETGDIEICETSEESVKIAVPNHHRAGDGKSRLDPLLN